MKFSNILAIGVIGALLFSNAAYAQKSKYRTNKAEQQILTIQKDGNTVKNKDQMFPGPIFFPGDLFFPGPIFFPGDLFDRASSTHEWTNALLRNARKYGKANGIIIFNKKSQFRAELAMIAELASTGARAGLEEYPQASEEMQKTVNQLNGALKVKLSPRDQEAAVRWLEDVNGSLDRILAMHKKSGKK